MTTGAMAYARKLTDARGIPSKGADVSEAAFPAEIGLHAVCMAGAVHRQEGAGECPRGNGHCVSGPDSNHRNQAALQDCERYVACCVGKHAL